MNIDVFLVNVQHTDVFEINFAYNFFYKQIKKLWGCTPHFIENEIYTSKIKSKKDILVFILDPLCIPSKETKKIFFDILSKKTDALVVPVTNESSIKKQQAIIPYQYWDIPTFCEVAALISQQNQIFDINTVDPFIFALHRKTFKKINVLIKDIPYIIPKKIVATGAFVHRFKNVFNAPREDLVSLVSPNTRKILDIGCAQGGFGKALKIKYPSIHITGIELSSSLAQEAAKIYDNIIIKDVENIEFEDKFDLINCGDIIEHLYNPWGLFDKIKKWLKPHGFLIGNIPNIGHWSIVKNLLEGKFEYIPLGLLCVGHIRFFTKDTLTDMLIEHGFKLKFLKCQTLPPTPKGEQFLNTILLLKNINIENLHTYSFLFKAQKQ